MIITTCHRALVCFLILLFYFGTSGGQDDVIFTDNFSSNSAAWETASNSTLQSNLVEGKYVINFNSTHSSGYWVVAPGYGDWAQAPVLDQPYELSFAVSNLSSSSGTLRIAVLFDVGKDYMPFKRLLFSNTEWQLIRWSGQREILAEDQNINQLNLMDGGTHNITLRVSEDEYVLLVNDRLVANIASFDQIAGTIGFGLDRGTAQNSELFGEFDNVVVTKLENESQDNAILSTTCTTDTTSEFVVGQVITLNMPIEDIPWFYGHPNIQGSFKSLSSFFDQVSEQGYIDRLNESLINTVNSSMLLVDGTYCYSDRLFWRLGDPNHSQYGFLDSRFTYLWTSEDMFEIAEKQFVVEHESYEPKTYILREFEAAPIISVEQQIAFGGGGFGGGGIPELWNVPECRISERKTALLNYENECMYIYPFDIGDTVEVATFQPDGELYSISNQETVSITITSDSADGSNFDSFTVGAVRFMVPDSLGIQPGVWTVTAKSSSTEITRSYMLAFDDSQREVRQYCDKSKPIFTHIPSFSG